MKKYLLSFLAIAFIITVVFMLIPSEEKPSHMDLKRAKHEKYLANSPYEITKNLNKKERKKRGLPPNGYNERMWELTMDPALGYPTPFLQNPIQIPSDFAKGAPGSATSTWTERGPRNVGGRTRVIFYDPNDVGGNNGDGVDYNRVFAGGVGGGLWVNDNINSNAKEWKIVPGLAGSLMVSSYAIDPIDSNTIYIGTGEQYTDGASIGNGLYKSTDGGNNWTLLNIPIAGGGDFGDPETTIFKSGIFHVNDIVVRPVNGQPSELYVGVGASIYSSPNFTTTNPQNFLGAQNAGIYRSTDGGLTWSRIEGTTLSFGFNGRQFPVIPNDFELNTNGKIYMSTIHTRGLNQGGGRIYSSIDGIEWRLETVISGGDRVELEASSTDPLKLYALAEVNGRADIFKTINGFQSLDQLSEPEDADLGISDTDFTRGQAFYDLMIEVDPINDEKVYVGGINVHRTLDGGTSWTQISKWSNNANMNTLTVPFVHADVHALTFNPGDSNQGLIGSDGGVSLVSSFNGASSNNSNISDRNFGYNVTQFYYGDIAQIDFENGDEFIAGSQDNGTQVFNNSRANRLTFTSDPSGGDGSYSAIDAESGYAILGYTSRTHYYVKYPIPFGNNILNGLLNSGDAYEISDENDGDFINVAELDSEFDVFYANSRTATNAPSITACSLGANAASCVELTDASISNGRATAMKASPFTTTTPTLYFGSQNSKLYRIGNANTNSAKTIVDISSPDFLGSISDIEFGASELEIYITMHNYGVNNIWFTNDGGITWAQKDGNLPDIPVKAILQNPLIANEVIIGTQMGIFATDDFDSASPTWTPSINGMTNVPVYDLDLRTADNTVLATTHGRGLYTGKFDATTASISNVAKEKALRIFPTQATSEIFLSSEKNYENVEIIIYNLSGQEVYRQKQAVSSNRQRIDVSTLSTGFYLLKAKGDGLNETTKFLKE
ncbi:T9SS type A sorting domain-containing protein [Nonlabens antarcticus]|uniref:T9SS type A sorting domain-containing protein n=1 Tax=Nonlabens antarcticus TaxID=392714 RepID=UPI001890DD65|nr:T9SS type A sorting domain-containing protein [Nonlabens antarcticus]